MVIHGLRGALRASERERGIGTIRCYLKGGTLLMVCLKVTPMGGITESLNYEIPSQIFVVNS